MKNIFLFILITGCLLLKSQVPNIHYAYSYNSAVSGSTVNTSTTDKWGNVYVIGKFTGTVDFNPGPASFTLVSAAGPGDVFVQKLTPAGNLIWAKPIKGNGTSVLAHDITTDKSGNIYLACGYVTGASTDVDMNAGVVTLPAYGPSENGTHYNSFLAKYDSAGTYLWNNIISTGGAFNNDNINRLAIDSVNNMLRVAGRTVYIGGGNNTVYFNGSTIINGLNAGSNCGWKLSLDLNGNYSSVGSVNSISWLNAYDVAVDNAGNTFYLYTSTSTGGMGTEVVKYNAAFAVQNLMAISSATPDALNIDNSGNIYLCGEFLGSNVDFDSSVGSYTLSSSGGTTDLYVAKYTNNMGFLFAGLVGSVTASLSCSDACLVGNELIITGIFPSGSIHDFDMGASSYTLSSVSANDIYCVSYSSGGALNWAAQIGKAGSTQTSNRINNYLNSGFLLSGFFQGSNVDYDMSGGTTNLTNPLVGWDNGFFAKYLGCASAPPQPTSVIGNNSICSGSAQTYSTTVVPGATSYIWSLPGGWSGTSATNVITTTASVSSGTVSVIAGNGCGSSPSQTLSVTVNSIPSTPGAIVGNITICEFTNQTYSITPVAGATSYSWSTPGGFVGTSTTNILNTAAGVNSGNIIVTASNACGTSPSQTVAIQVNNAPLTPGTINGLNTICAGAGATTYSIATVVGATSYTWSIPVGWSGSSATNIISATPGSTGIFTVTASNLCGTSPQQTLSVTVNLLPTINASTTNTMLCVGQSATLTASGASSYTFNPGGASTSIVVSPSVTSTYTINGTGANGCTNSSSFTQSVSTCAGIKTFEEALGLVVYPNPTTGKITITYKINWLGFEIYNSLGEKLSPTTVHTKTGIEIDLTSFPNGIYFVRVKDSNSSVVRKIIKQ